MFCKGLFYAYPVSHGQSWVPYLQTCVLNFCWSRDIIKLPETKAEGQGPQPALKENWYKYYVLIIHPQKPFVNIVCVFKTKISSKI